MEFANCFSRWAENSRNLKTRGHPCSRILAPSPRRASATASPTSDRLMAPFMSKAAGLDSLFSARLRGRNLVGICGPFKPVGQRLHESMVECVLDALPSVDVDGPFFPRKGYSGSNLLGLAVLREFRERSNQLRPYPLAQGFLGRIVQAQIIEERLNISLVVPVLHSHLGE